MNYDNRKIAGFLFFVGVVQFVLTMVASESIYSGYSVGQQYVSDLGNWSLAGNSAAIFNASVILMGVFIIAGAYFIQRELKSRLFSSLVVIIGVGIIGLGVVAEDVSFSVHSIFALFVFVFGGAFAIMLYKFEKSPLSHISAILGAIMLAALVLFISGWSSSSFYLGLGLGGMERFIIYPFLLWILGFGAYLIGESSNTALTSNT